QRIFLPPSSSRTCRRFPHEQLTAMAIRSTPGSEPEAQSFKARRDGFDHRLFVGELAGLQLRVDQFPLHSQLEAASARGNQLQIVNPLLHRSEQLARQTDGLRLVVSHRTVFELDVHEKSPCLFIVPFWYRRRVFSANQATG